MRTFLLFALFILFPCLLPAQELWQLNSLKNENREATIKEIQMHFEKATAFWKQYPDSSVALLKAVYIESQRIHFNYGMAKTLLTMGSILLNKEAVIGETSQSATQQARAYIKSAYPYCLKGDSLKEYLLIRWHCGMGASFASQGIYDSAIVYYFKALNIVAKMDQSTLKQEIQSDIVYLYHNIGFAYYWVHQNEKALLYLRKAEEGALKKKFKQELAEIYSNFVAVFIKENRFDEARAYLDKMDTLMLQAHERIPRQHSIYGYFYLAREEPAKAIPYLKLSIAKRGKGRITGLKGLGLAYLSLKQFPQAERYLTQALKESQILEGQAQNADLYNHLSIVYDSLSNYKKAYQHLYTATALQDSINQREKVTNINELEVRYRTALKDKELTAQKLTLEKTQNQLNKRNLWMAGIPTALLIIILLLIQRGRIRTQREKVAQLKARLAGEEKERNRIGQQLHDDVMVEFSIARMNLETLPEQHPEIKMIAGYDSAVQQLNRASTKLRQTAHNLMPNALLEEGLVPVLSYFCNNVEQTSKLKIDFQHYGNLPRLAIEMEVSLYRMVQELIQNIIKHANARQVLVQMNYRKGFLSLTIEDDGVGMQPETTKDGMGLKSIKTALKALNGTLEIHPCEPKGTSIHIELTNI